MLPVTYMILLVVMVTPNQTNLHCPSKISRIKEDLTTNCSKILCMWVSYRLWEKYFTKTLMYSSETAILPTFPLYQVTAHLEVYSEPCQMSKMELFAKIVNDWKPLTISAKSSFLDVWQGSAHDSDYVPQKCCNVP